MELPSKLPLFSSTMAKSPRTMIFDFLRKSCRSKLLSIPLKKTQKSCYCWDMWNYFCNVLEYVDVEFKETENPCHFFSWNLHSHQILHSATENVECSSGGETTYECIGQKNGNGTESKKPACNLKSSNYKR